MKKNETRWLRPFLGALLAVVAIAPAMARDVQLLNVSYDPTRELYKDYNAAFARHWKETKGETVNIETSPSTVTSAVPETTTQCSAR